MILRKKPFENIVRKEKKNLETSIFSFSVNVFYPSQNKFQLSFTFYLLSADAFNLDQSESLSCGKVSKDIVQ